MNKLLISILSILAILALSGSASAVGNVYFDFPDDASVGDEILVNISSDTILDPGCRYNITISGPVDFDVQDITMKYKALNGTWRESEWPSGGPYISGGNWSVQLPDGTSDSVSGINLSDNMSAMANFTINNGAPVGQYSISIELLNMTTATVNATGTDTMTVDGVEIDSAGEGYSTIQYAIDNATGGDTINVAAGIYDEEVNVNKNVTLTGVNDPNGANPAWVKDRINVKVDGVTIKNLKVTNMGNSGEQEGIFVDGAGYTDYSSQVIEISNNVIDGVNSTSSDKAVEGIHVKSYDSGTQIDGVKILDNVIRNIAQPDYGSDGIKLQADLNNVTVENNIIENVNGLWSYGVVATPSSSEFGTPKNVTIERNSFSSITASPNTTWAVAVAMDTKSGNFDSGTIANASEIIVHWNDFGDTYFGVVNKDNDEVLDARYNWWGSENGPSHSTNVLPNTGINVSDNVTFTPWLDAPGGEPTAPIEVNGDYYSNLQDAIDNANPGDTIRAGSFVFSPVEINKNVTLTAASSPVIDCSGSSQKNGVNITSDYVTIDSFEIKNCEIGVNSSMTNFTNVTNCYIHDNTKGVYIGDGSNNKINNSDIEDNTDVGVSYGNTAGGTLDATRNWWGDPSGPSGQGKGTGDAIDNVNITYEPWLGTEGQSVYFTGYATSGSITDEEFDARKETDVNVSVSGTADISIGKYSTNPVKGVYYGYNITSIEKYVDVFKTTVNPNSVTVKLYYAESDITGKNESTLNMYWWNETAGEWDICENTTVNTADGDGYLGYVSATINGSSKPNLTELSGTVFSAGGQPIETGEAPTSGTPAIGGFVGPVDKLAVAAPYIVATIMCVFAIGATTVARRR